MIYFKMLDQLQQITGMEIRQSGKRDQLMERRRKSSPSFCYCRPYMDETEPSRAVPILEMIQSILHQMQAFRRIEVTNHPNRHRCRLGRVVCYLSQALWEGDKSY